MPDSLKQPDAGRKCRWDIVLMQRGYERPERRFVRGQGQALLHAASTRSGFAVSLNAAPGFPVQEGSR